MAEKVRYYLEQSVPELQDLKKKGLFDKNEITMIMRRRTDFEHRITGRGAKPRDFLKYADFEKNLERLRRKRYSRLNKVGLVETKPSVSDWSGPRRILFIYDRATRKFQGDSNIWDSYLKYAKKSGAIKVVYKAYSRLLQLQPRNADAWISAAKYEFEDQSNAKTARVLLQRGLRFNSDSLDLWLNYCKFELSYVSKLLARRKVLGLITERQQLENLKDEEAAKREEIENSSKLLPRGTDNTMDDDKIMLPEVGELKDELKQLPEAELNVLGNPETNPALRGDVALTVYEVGIQALLKNIPINSTIIDKYDKLFELSTKFLEIFDQFKDVDRNYLCKHIIQYLLQNIPISNPNYKNVLILDISLPIRFDKVTDDEFTDDLKMSINNFMAYKSKLASKKEEKEKITELYVHYLQENFLNSSDPKPNERTITLLQAIIKRCRQS
ncbi:hypothetical protein PACTADRAFT_39661 [Pachysolen tannophilus NRRL Y-2460]|uniref:U3 small nucleolar RNA-associated protein 6 N-terminal domain-containing protein n=1 Tax=Pachysolen tannophilus NRRL Y-2460 TaxID=669874 RepID=A0A1E4TYK3_PACTA|nr:hypothetical protein PACTADRAFT_39661 [Pachysolen tannophilus NRRL Y-2460]